MALSCGIVGLPNVGKSTLFNALTNSENAEAANYPFCTIDPNTGLVPVPDERLWVLKDIAGTNKVIPAQVELVDIAGLVKGAHQGAGKGNAFLANVRSVDAILHVVRCFDDDDIVHVDGSIDPVRDIEVIDLELVMKDEETVRGKLERCRKRRNDKEAQAAIPTLDKVLAAFADITPVRALDLSDDELEHIADCQLITAKPMLFVCNVSDGDLPDGNAYSKAVQAHAAKVGAGSLVICGQIEGELNALDEEERAIFMEDLGLSEPGLNTLVKAAYDLLGLAVYFTAGVQEVRAWQI
ncbi:MAG: redox-regulated ATPase YchF, partial [Planctomycetota bacterium]